MSEVWGVTRSRWSPRFWLPTLVAVVIASLLWEWIAIGNPYLLPRLGQVGLQLVTP